MTSGTSVTNYIYYKIAPDIMHPLQTVVWLAELTVSLPVQIRYAHEATESIYFFTFFWPNPPSCHPAASSTAQVNGDFPSPFAYINDTDGRSGYKAS
jgi:hypothetical protein